jgi:hypothetical protein
MQRGTKLDLVLTGTNLADPTGLWTSFPAKVTIPTDMNNGKDNTKLRVVLEVPADAPLGFHSLRLATTRGMSNFRPFCIDDLPQVLEVDTNRNRSTPQALNVPCVVVGRADAEISDWYKITVKANQRVSFEILGRRLGSAFDPQLSLYDAKTGHDLPGGFSNDAPGLQTDARLSYAFKEAGDYLIEVRDVMYRGGPDFHYRLRVGDFPCATTPYPLMVQRGVKTTVNFAGPNVAGIALVEVTAPADPTVNVLWLAPKGLSGLHGWPVALMVSDLPQVTEQEPNNEPAKANRVNVPCGISGRLLEKGDVDHYVFAAKKGQRFIIEAQTLELFSPTEVYLILKDAKGGQLAASNPDVAPRIDYTATADGDLIVHVEHLHYWGGPEETYHLTINPYEPGFNISVGLDRYDAAQGGTFSIPIIATRRDYAGPIDVTVVGTGLSGTVTIPGGPPKPPNVPSGTLIITVAPDAPVGPLTFHLQGKATINMKPVARLGTFRLVVNQVMATLPFPPPHYETRLGVAVRTRPPFTLTAKFDAANVEPGKPITATVTAVRGAGFVDEIALTATGFPPTIKAAPASIPKGMNEAKVTFTVAPNAAAGTFPVTFNGKAKAGTVDVIGNSPPASLVVFVIPFDLKAEPLPLKIQQGGKVKLKVMATRKAYAGPITLEVKNLPAGVTAPKATIPNAGTVIEIELTALATAAVGDKADVHVSGVATPPGTPRVSPNFTLSVLKK